MNERQEIERKHEREELLSTLAEPRVQPNVTGIFAIQLALAQWISGILRRLKLRKQR